MSRASVHRGMGEYGAERHLDVIGGETGEKRWGGFDCALEVAARLDKAGPELRRMAHETMVLVLRHLLRHLAPWGQSQCARGGHDGEFGHDSAGAIV